MLTDFVADDDEPIAQVLLFLDPHLPVVRSLVSLAPALGAPTFALKLWRVRDESVCGFIDDDSLALTRRQALEHPEKDAVFAIVDAVTLLDARVREHLGKSDVSH